MSEQDMYQLDTPSLLLNLNTLEENLQRIIHFTTAHEVDYRPHIKTHKSVDIANMQIENGAIGITVATVGEAEVMTAGGIEDILIAYPVASIKKLERIAKITSKAKIILTVDSTEQATMINDFFTRKKNQIDVWIKVNSGLNRCGVEVEEVIDLAKHIKRLPALSLQGIFTHAGHSYAAASHEEMKQIATQEAQSVVRSSDLCERAGIYIKHRSVGSTPTYQTSGAVEGITEVRPGNAVFFDMVQVGLGVATIENCALTVLSSIGSIKPNRIVIDAGSKTLNLDKGAHGNESITGHGYIQEYPHLTLERLSEEHGVIPLSEEVQGLHITDKLTIIPNHACTVVNLFDEYIVHRDGRIVDTWKVHARGRND